MAAEKTAATPVKIHTNDIKVNLDTTINKDDLVNLRVVEVEDSLNEERVKAENELATLSREYDKATKKLENLAEVLVEAQEDNDADTKALLDLLRKKSGHAYAAIFVSSEHAERYVGYGQQRNEEKEVEVDLNKAKIRGKIRIVEKRDGQGRKSVVYARVSSILDWPHEVDFTEDMRNAVKDIEVKAAAVTSVKDRLTDIKRRIGDLPRMRRRVEAAMTRAILDGSITDGASLIEAVTSPEIKSLPLPPAH